MNRERHTEAETDEAAGGEVWIIAVWIRKRCEQSECCGKGIAVPDFARRCEAEKGNDVASYSSGHSKSPFSYFGQPW